ncbi:MAG TPA: type II secretion system F family protein [Anaerolineae bacterium]
MINTIFSPATVGILVGMCALALALAFRPTHASRMVESRLTSFLSAIETERAADKVAELDGSLLERVLIPGLRKLLQLIARATPGQNWNALNEKLTIAGHPANLTAAEFVGIRWITLIAGLIAGFVAGRSLADGMPMLRWLAPLGGLILGFLLPRIWLDAQIRKRRETIQCSLPDALDMLTICVEAGLAFESALQRVADQWAGPLSEEFSRAVSEMRLGVPRVQTLRNVAKRCDTPDVSAFVAVLVQADTMGTGVAQVLHSQSDQIRTLRRQRAEEKANKAPIKVLLAMVIFIFPALFVVLLGPAIPRIMEAFGG